MQNWEQGWLFEAAHSRARTSTSIKKGEKGLFKILFGGSKPSAWLSHPGKQTCQSLSPSLLLLNPVCGFPASHWSCDPQQRSLPDSRATSS